MQARHLLFQEFSAFYVNVKKVSPLFLLAAQFLSLSGAAGERCVRLVILGRNVGLSLHPVSYRKVNCTDLYLALRSMRQRVLFLEGMVMASVVGLTGSTFLLSPVME